MNSKMWMSGVGTLCANAHYPASVFIFSLNFVVSYNLKFAQTCTSRLVYNVACPLQVVSHSSPLIWRNLFKLQTAELCSLFLHIKIFEQAIIGF